MPYTPPSRSPSGSPGLFVLTLTFFLTAMAPAFGQSQPIDGFRDLKFGMTEQEVEALDVCSSPTECLYELAGKNRYVYPLYRKLGTQGRTGGNGQEPPRLARITIDMGAYTDEWYGELQVMLGGQYRLTKDLTKPEMRDFLAERTSDLTSEYEQGQILLTVHRRKFGNLILKVVYQTPSMATEGKRSAPAP